MSLEAEFDDLLSDFPATAHHKNNGIGNGYAAAATSAKYEDDLILIDNIDGGSETNSLAMNGNREGEYMFTVSRATDSRVEDNDLLGDFCSTTNNVVATANGTAVLKLEEITGNAEVHLIDIDFEQLHVVKEEDTEIKACTSYCEVKFNIGHCRYYVH